MHFKSFFFELYKLYGTVNFFFVPNHYYYICVCTTLSIYIFGTFLLSLAVHSHTPVITIKIGAFTTQAVIECNVM